MAETPVEYLIEANHVSKVFKDFWGRPKVRAVTDVSLRLPRGSIMGLLGPNGAGKSTLMKMILGHLYPTAGQLAVFGKVPTDVASKARLGYLPERSYLYKNLTPEETLRFFGEVLELSRPVIRERTAQLLRMVGLEHAGRRLTGEFSHGMMRRMGLAQALLNDPDLLLLDEPTAGLDPIGCREVKNLLLTLARRGKTILMTSHLLADIEDVCDQVTIMYGGRVLANGPIRELLAHKDQLQINLPAPDDATVKAVRELLGKAVPPAAIEFTNPTRSLEAYFLEVVREASTKQETHGAHLGDGVATYLREGVAEDGDALEALAHARREPAPARNTASEAPVDQAELARLSGDQAPAAPAASAPPEADIDRQLLDDLTRKKP